MNFLDNYILRDIVSDDIENGEILKTKLNPLYNFGYGLEYFRFEKFRLF